MTILAILASHSALASCECTAFADPVLLFAGGAPTTFNVMLRNDDTVNSCGYDVTATSSTFTIVDDSTGLPLNASGLLAPSEQKQFLLRATAPSNANANAVVIPTANGGTEFEYIFFNDGQGFCQVEGAACVVPSAETNVFTSWTDLQGTAPGVFANFQVTVSGGSATFYGRLVREVFGAAYADSCFYPGSFYDEIDPANILLGEWAVSSSSNVLVNTDGSATVDRIGVIEPIVAWYRGDQAGMTAAQLAAIANNTAIAPPDLATTPPNRCGFVWEQRMRMFCEHPQGPTGYARYLTQPLVIDIVGAPTSQLEVTRGTSGAQVLPRP